MATSFKPQLVQLTEHGKSAVSVSANFREALENNSIFVLELPNEAGNVKVSTDEKGSVIMLLPTSDIVMTLNLFYAIRNSEAVPW